MVLLWITGAVQAQQVEPSVAHSLAVYRRATISGVTYRLSFTIPAIKTEKIAATATISFMLADTSQPLQLDFRQDSGHVHAIRVNGQSIAIDLRNEHLVIHNQWLKKDSNTINIQFTAGNESLNRNNDYLYALFVPDRARTVFPCFDQPDLKAIFMLSLSVPAGWSVLGNAPIHDSAVAGNNTVYHFKPSDQLPTYLFSFTAGKYAVANAPGMQFLYRETDSAKIKLSVDSVFHLHKKAIAFMEEWTGIRFPFQKVGFAAIPAFQFGGMEHPGAVQYNAPALFLDKGATKDQLIARSALIAHETAHMWFGDLVTMQWFNDVWMKEVFANFMADKIAEKLMGSETFQLKFLLDHTPAAFGVDRTRGANPIRQQLDNLKDAGSMYGNIIYHKAPIMMQQLERLMGKAAFRKGVQQYLHTYSYGNANWDNLIAILGKYTTADLLTWNKIWVNRAGRPVFDYEYKNGQLMITQSPERDSAGVWPQQFSVLVFYGNDSNLITVNMKTAKSVIPLPAKPSAILFNADGMGYGLFPALMDEHLYRLRHPVQRGAAYINAYENMLANSGVKAGELLVFFMNGLEKETNELNLRTMCGYIANVYWNFRSPTQRASNNAALEQALRNAMARQTTANNKKILFKAYQDIYESPAAASYMYNVWQLQKAPDNIKLTEDDYTSLALTIALKTDTANTVIQQQLARVADPDRRARLQFLTAAVAPDSLVRDSLFLSLSDITNRRKEAWVAAALSYMNHPLRQKSFFKFLPASLNMLEDIQRTGDIFFPQNWLQAIFGNYQSTAAWRVVNDFLNQHPTYNPKLKARILQTTDNLYRAHQQNAHN